MGDMVAVPTFVGEHKFLEGAGDHFEYAGIRTVMMQDPENGEVVPKFDIDPAVHEHLVGTDEIADGLGESYVAILIDAAQQKGIGVTVLEDGRAVARGVEIKTVSQN